MVSRHSNLAITSHQNFLVILQLSVKCLRSQCLLQQFLLVHRFHLGTFKAGIRSPLPWNSSTILFIYMTLVTICQLYWLEKVHKHSKYRVNDTLYSRHDKLIFGHQSSLPAAVQQYTIFYFFNKGNTNLTRICKAAT